MRRTPLLAPAAFLLAGCATGTLRIEDLRGVEYVVEGGGMGMEDRDGTSRVYNSRATLRVRDGRVYRGEEDLGPIRAGDHVRLTRDGRVYVNGIERAGRPLPPRSS